MHESSEIGNVLEEATIEFLPQLKEKDIEGKKKWKLSMMDVAAMGIAANPIITAISTLKTPGQSGLYYVNTMGKSMFNFRGSNQFLGTLKDTTGAVGGGQAKLSPITFNPTMLFMAVAIKSVEHKMDEIKALQEEILSYLKSKEKAKLRGDISFLVDILENYKYNLQNDMYKQSALVNVQRIKNEAEQSIVLQRDQVKKQLEKQKMLHMEGQVRSRLNRVSEELEEYQVALYLYGLSSYLEIVLLENFSADYLNSVEGKIDLYSQNYRELHKTCYEFLEEQSQKSVQSVLAKGISGAAKGLGNAIRKNEFLSKGPVDEFFLGAGEKMDKAKEKMTSRTMDKLLIDSESIAEQFIESIQNVNDIFNKPKTLLFDNDNIILLGA